MTDLDFFDTGLWDITACCRYYQTGVCVHTEAAYEDLDTEPTYGPHITIDRQAWLDAGAPTEPF